ncbi:MAG TPA: M20/M25/M40 family metallo-hydrolase [Kofleriaceae bacterium]|nr:M20/M25/M40 family metallo-hydrolase [Kofleriaceae bacterium]
MRLLSLSMFAALTITACSTTEAPTVKTDPDQDPSAETKPHYVSIDRDALATAQEALAQRDPSAQLELVDMWNDVALVKVEGQDLKALSQLMHVNHNRCGGFIVHDTLDDARAALRAKDMEGIASLITYTIDNATTVNTLLPQLSQANVLTTIQQLSGGAGFTTRYYTSTGGGQSSTWLKNLWAGYAASRPEVTVELYETGWAQKSVIAKIPGTSLASEVVVLGGHLDSINQSGGNAPGADDDASGIASLSEVFRVLMAMNYRPQRTVHFMAYAGEEVGLLGSKQIVNTYKAAATNVVGVMQLDMTNYKGSTNDIVFMTDYTNAAQNTFAGSLVDTYLTGITRTTDVCGYGCSDHASWHNAGYAASMPFESKMAQYNPTIHTANDTLAQSGNSAAHAIKFSKLATAYVAELAKGTIDTSGNTAPSVSISAPANGSSYPAGTSVTMTGSANDTQDGPLSNAIVWTSSIDGSLGTGASVVRTLSSGSHTITARATDSGNLSSTATISVTIGSSATPLSNGVPVTGLADSTAGNFKFYTIAVPAGQSTLTITMSGGTGDADMYVNFGAQPSDTVYQCRPYLSGNNETCTFSPPSAGTYFIGLRTYAAYTGISLTATYGSSSGCATGDPVITNGVGQTVSGAASSTTYRCIKAVPAGKTLTLKISGGTGDADLYTQFNARPTTSAYLCRPYLSGNNETCTHTITATNAGDWYVMLRAFSAYSGTTLIGSY